MPDTALCPADESLDSTGVWRDALTAPRNDCRDTVLPDSPCVRCSTYAVRDLALRRRLRRKEGRRVADDGHWHRGDHPYSSGPYLPPIRARG